jgi:hypothetical protein
MLHTEYAALRRGPTAGMSLRDDTIKDTVAVSEHV